MEKQRTRKRRERAEHNHKATKLARNSEELGDKALLPHLELRRRPISTGSSSGEAKVVDLTEDNSEDEVIDLTVPSRTSAPQMSPKKDDDVIVIPSSPATLTSIPDSPSSPSKQLISCPVCMESVKTFTASGRLLVTTKCGHLFCDKCIQKTIGLLHKCPTCSTKLTQRQFHRIYI